MAMFECPGCKRIVDEGTKTCPNCDYNIKKYVKELQKEAKRRGSKTIGSGNIALNDIYNGSPKTSSVLPTLDFLKETPKEQAVFESPSLNNGGSAQPQPLFDSPALNAAAGAATNNAPKPMFDSPALNAAAGRSSTSAYNPMGQPNFNAVAKSGELSAPVSAPSPMYDLPQTNSNFRNVTPVSPMAPYSATEAPNQRMDEYLGAPASAPVPAANGSMDPYLGAAPAPAANGSMEPYLGAASAPAPAANGSMDPYLGAAPTPAAIPQQPQAPLFESPNLNNPKKIAEPVLPQTNPLLSAPNPLVGTQPQAPQIVNTSSFTANSQASTPSTFTTSSSMLRTTTAPSRVRSGSSFIDSAPKIIKQEEPKEEQLFESPFLNAEAKKIAAGEVLPASQRPATDASDAGSIFNTGVSSVANNQINSQPAGMFATYGKTTNSKLPPYAAKEQYQAPVSQAGAANPLLAAGNPMLSAGNTVSNGMSNANNPLLAGNPFLGTTDNQ